jgi:hypothetical protein
VVEVFILSFQPDRVSAVISLIVLVVYLVWTWEGLPDWVAKHQSDDEHTTLGNIQPLPLPPPLSATVHSPPSENIKVVDSAKAELVPKLEAIVLFFNEADRNGYQTGGRVERTFVGGGNVVCDETIYRIGVRSNTALPKCRLVLVASEPAPHDPGMHRLGLPMRPRIPVSPGSEEFNVNPNAPAYVDVLQEIRPLNNLMNEAANIRLIYVNEDRGKANWFENGQYVETFQLEGPSITTPIKFRLEVEFDGRRAHRRWRVRSVD